MAAKKKAAFEPFVPGHPPPPLPPAEPALASLRDALAAVEALALTEPRTAQLRAEALEGEPIDPALAARLLAALPRDFGEVPENGPDPAQAKTVPQRKALDAAFTARITARLARERTFATLQALAARDLAFQARAFASLDEWTGGSHLLRGAMHAALLRAPTLAPEVAEAVRRAAVVRPPTAESGAAIAAAFRQGWAESLLYPCLDRLASMGDHHHAKMVVEIGASHGFFARDPGPVRARLEGLAKLADLPYDWTKGDEGRAPLQLGFAAREALAALDARAPVTPKAAPKPTQARRAAPAVQTPVDRKKLRTPAAREAALDALGAFVVDALVDADDARARAVLTAAISAFYDVREAAGQERQEYAGHFFLVDAVGLDASDRPVPWNVLRERVGEARLAQLTALFEEVEAAAT